MHHGDLVMVLTAIQSVKNKDKVAKLSYVVRVPFQSVRGIGCGSYKARKTNTPDCPDLKFMSEDLYILSPSLRSCEPIVSCDSPYLNQSHAPIVNPLKNTSTSSCITKDYLSNNLKPSPHHLSMIILL